LRREVRLTLDRSVSHTHTPVPRWALASALSFSLSFPADPYTLPIDPADDSVGPFFLGFCLQALGGIHATITSSSHPPCLLRSDTRCQWWSDLTMVIGMGVVLVLSISYFHGFASRHKLRLDTSGRSGVVLVALSLVFNLAQTIIDLYRGYIVCLSDSTILPAINRSSITLPCKVCLAISSRHPTR
jgi:hypothetical protein